MCKEKRRQKLPYLSCEIRNIYRDLSSGKSIFPFCPLRLLPFMFFPNESNETSSTGLH